MTDAERIKLLEDQVAMLFAERAVTGGLVILLRDILLTLELERQHFKDRPSLVEMLDSGDVVWSMNAAPGTLPGDVDRARDFARRILEDVRSRAPLDRKPPAKPD